MAHGAASTLSFPYVALIVPFDEGERQANAMENCFQAWSDDQPFALELVGTRREQGFLLRASSEQQLARLCKQLEAQYPQAEIHRIDPRADPLLLHAGEHVLVGEFTLARAAWKPLKTFPGETLAEEGADPLPGLFAAMEAVGSSAAGSGERICCQLALVRAPDNWIAPSIRRAVEHPLQGERDAFAAALKGEATTSRRGLLALGLLGGMLTVLWGAQWYRAHSWLPLALLALTWLCALILLVWWWVRSNRREIYDMKMVAEKLQRAAFYTQLRVMAIGSPPPLAADEARRRAALSAEELDKVRQADQKQLEERLRAHLKAMEIAYQQFSLASANSLRLKRIRHLRATDEEARWLLDCARAFPFAHPLQRFLHRGWSKDICNGLELSGMFHLPQAFTDLPLVKRLSVKHLLFSPEVAHHVEQAAAPMPPVCIGHSTHRRHATPVLLPYATLFAHKLLVGRSRSGKSALIQLLVAGAMRQVRDGSPQPGIFCIDPHRDLVFDILRLIPPGRAKDVLLLDFTSPSHAVGLNPLDATMGLTRDQIVSSFMSCSEQIWEKYWGPRMSFFLKNICLLLVTLNFKLCAEGRANEQYTLLDINPILQYKDYATLVLSQLDRTETWHQELLAFFQHTYWTLPANSSFRQEIIMPILSKMSVFSDNVQLRRIFGQPVTTAPVHEAVTEGKIVLAALSSRDMDENSVNVLGSTLINLLHYAFTRQQDIPLLQRRKCFVAVDELQNFSGSAFDKLLSEDAKWGCAGLFTTQYLARLNEVKKGLLELLLSNCENLGVFNVSAADAKVLEEEFQQKVTQKHIISQPRLHCYVRLAIAGFPLQFASVTLAQPASWAPSAAGEAQVRALQQQSQSVYKTATAADNLHKEHLRKFLDVSVFADRIEKDAEAIRYNRAQREEAELLEAELLQGTGQAASPSNGSAAPGPATQQPTLPGMGQEAQAQAQQATNADSQGKRTHPRSRRMKRFKGKKSPVGTPPPGLEQSDADQRPSPLSGSTGWSIEGRERERGA